MITYTITSPYALKAAQYILAMLLEATDVYHRFILSRAFILILKGQNKHQ